MQSTVYIFYKYLGLNPWVILALADNQYAKNNINVYLKEQYGGRFTFDDVFSKFIDYSKLSYLDRRYIIEAEFLKRTGNLSKAINLKE